jgi:peptide deformylase
MAAKTATLNVNRPIVTVQDRRPVLRAVARPVRRVDRAVRRLMDDMLETMREAPGVGLAAPQVDVSLRVIVVETPVDSDDPDGPTRVRALADPEIVWFDPDLVEDQEACLSIPGLYGDVPRHMAIRVRALDRSGRRIEFDAEGFEARVIQHEMDHLDGVLFTDRVSGIDKLYYIRENEQGEIVRVPFRSAASA